MFYDIDCLNFQPLGLSGLRAMVCGSTTSRSWDQILRGDGIPYGWVRDIKSRMLVCQCLFCLLVEASNAKKDTKEILKCLIHFD